MMKVACMQIQRREMISASLCISPLEILRYFTIHSQTLDTRSWGTINFLFLSTNFLLQVLSHKSGAGQTGEDENLNCTSRVLFP